jgi:O-antigen/teichoic acid export membrane protein
MLRFVKIREVYRHFATDSLYRNSIYLMLSTAVMALFGFVFWLLSARLFSPAQVGIATTLISVMTLLSNISILGFNVSLIRYLPQSMKKNDTINSAILLVVAASIVTSLIFVGFTGIFSPTLQFLQKNALYVLTFTIFVISVSLNTLLESIFVAYRASGNILVKNSILSLSKILFLFPFFFIGSYGIFSAFVFAILISMLLGFGILIAKYSYRPIITLQTTVIREMAVFSGGNYIAGFLHLAPTLLLPIFIINNLNAETAAYYYISSMILGFLTVIPTAASQSLLAEGSHDQSGIARYALKAAKLTLITLIPAVFLTVFFGNVILSAFGNSYAQEAFGFLQLVSISAIFISLSSLLSAILKIRHQVKGLIIINFFGAFLTLGLSYLFMQQGLLGVGKGWLLGQVLLSIIYVGFVGKDLSLKSIWKSEEYNVGLKFIGRNIS